MQVFTCILISDPGSNSSVYRTLVCGTDFKLALFLFTSFGARLDDHLLILEQDIPVENQRAREQLKEYP